MHTHSLHKKIHIHKGFIEGFLGMAEREGELEGG